MNSMSAHNSGNGSVSDIQSAVTMSGVTLPPKKHVCIFELERKGGSFTSDVICTVCGFYLSSHNPPSRRQTPPASVDGERAP